MSTTLGFSTNAWCLFAAPSRQEGRSSRNSGAIARIRPRQFACASEPSKYVIGFVVVQAIMAFPTPDVAVSRMGARFSYTTIPYCEGL